MNQLKTHIAGVVTAAVIGAFAFLGPVTTAGAADATPLVSTDWLNDNLDNPDVLVLDIRSPLAKSGQEDYLKAHIPGAVWSEYPGYWRTTRGEVSGVLPSVEKMEASLSDLGVHEDRTVIIVPAGVSDLDFGAATRIYWTFKYLGHDKVAILDGGHAAWVNAGYQLDAGNVEPEGDMFVAEVRDELLVSTDDVASLLGQEAVLLDSRPQNQFDGQEKHEDATRFGHLPGAVHFDQAQLYDPQTNKLKSEDELKKLTGTLASHGSAPVIAYCNTGHWAATNWFVLSELLGRTDVTVYDESLVGWSRQTDLPLSSPATATN